MIEKTEWKKSQLQQFSCCALHSLRFMGNVLVVMLLLLLAYKPPSQLSHAVLYNRQHQTESALSFVCVCVPSNMIYLLPHCNSKNWHQIPNDDVFHVCTWLRIVTINDAQRFTSTDHSFQIASWKIDLISLRFTFHFFCLFVSYDILCVWVIQGEIFAHNQWLSRNLDNDRKWQKTVIYNKLTQIIGSFNKNLSQLMLNFTQKRIVKQWWIMIFLICTIFFFIRFVYCPY